jgi:3-ketoacyl-CoA synthase
MLFFPVLNDVFAKNRMPPSVVGALVVNCSGLCPASSLTSITTNRRPTARPCMCCGAGSIGVDITAGVLRAHCMSYRMPPLTFNEKMQTISPINSFILCTIKQAHTH